MESMDRDQAFAFLGLSEGATQDDIQSRVDVRRRQLELRLKAAVTPEQRRLLERALNELEEIRALALLDPRDPAAGLPGGAGVALKTGMMLADRYVIKGRVGVGERGAVYRALDLTWGQDVAIKVLVPEMLLVPGTMDRLAAILRRHLGFAHPAIAAVYALGSDSGITFIVSELVEGETLRQHLPQAGVETAFDAAAIARVIQPLCAALVYAADRAPHLNLKPENVIIAADGSVKVTDFGLEEVITAIPRGRSRAMTEQRRFRAPEQIRRTRNVVLAPEPVDGRADQFAVGALAYFLATGEAPVADAADLGQRRPDLPGSLVAAVRRALSAAPDARFESATALCAAMFAQRSVTARRLGFIAATVGLVIAAAIAGVLTVKPELLGHLSWISSRQSDGAAVQQQASALRQRTEDLKARLQTAEQTLRARLREARMTVEMREAAGAKTAPPDLAEARATRDMLESLSTLAVPQVFNSPDLLNAYNLLALANSNMNDQHYRDAIAVLSVADAVMSARLADLHEAERLAKARYGLHGAADLGLAEGDSPDELRAVWENAVTERRRFAMAVDQGLVLIPGGNFTMGDLTGNGSRAETPIHPVKVAAFKIGRAPVTRGEFAACVDAGACRADVPSSENAPTDPRLPMTGVSWIDAQDYTAWLRLRTGEDYRLPSEAEWEYAARAGAGTDYPWGNTIGRNRANCASCGSAWDGLGPAPVASFPSNAFELHDVVGNVWQWTADCWYRDYSTAPATAAPRDELACQTRVLRGGSWDNDPWMARISYRSGAGMNLRQDINGFRIAKSME